MSHVYHERLQRLGIAERLVNVCVYDATYIAGTLVSVFVLSCTGGALSRVASNV
jgi:hypothetical protein